MNAFPDCPKGPGGDVPLWGPTEIKEAETAARKLFACQGLKSVAGYIASRHPYALSYLEAAPAIACSPKLGMGKQAWQSGKTAANEKAAKLLWAALERHVEAGAPLRTVMDAAGVVYPLRKLDANALFRGKTGVLAGLSLIEPAVLGRAIPDGAGPQRVWLGLMASWIGLWATRFSNTANDVYLERLEWAAVQFGLAATEDSRTSRGTDVSALVDYVKRGDRFNTAQTLRRAQEDLRAWNSRTTMIERIQRLHVDYGLIADDVADPDTFEDEVVEGYTFVQLRTVMDFVTESVELDHCVWTYAPRARSGQCHIFGIRNAEGGRVATLEVNPSMRPAQLRGPHNHQPPEAVIKAAVAFGKLMAAHSGLKRHVGPAELADQWLREPGRNYGGALRDVPIRVVIDEGLPTIPHSNEAVVVNPRPLITAQLAPGEVVRPGDALTVGSDGLARVTGRRRDADIVNALVGRGRGDRVIIDDPFDDQISPEARAAMARLLFGDDLTGQPE